MPGNHPAMASTYSRHAMPRIWTDRAALESSQSLRLAYLFKSIQATNRFYAEKYEEAGLQCVDGLEDLAEIPFTTKAELLANQETYPPYGTNLTYQKSVYVRMHQTSGSRGQPLRWLDTAASWNSMLESWKMIFQIVGVREDDRLVFPFSFGPFLGFWSAFEAGTRMGCLCLPAGGMSTKARLLYLLENHATVVLCTPTYALYLAEVAKSETIDLTTSDVRLIIVAGEPGGSIPATRERLEQDWGARISDHSGMTEVGPLTVECPEEPGVLQVLETDYIAEIIDPRTLQPALRGEVGELVVTNLGRIGSPLIRYRTGDLVRASLQKEIGGRIFLGLEGGILGRCDDMIHVRGNNLYPGALEAIVRRFADVAEYRIFLDERNAMTNIRMEIEPALGSNASSLAERVRNAIRDELLFRAEVVTVPPGTLPRFEMKANRIVRL